MVNGEMKNNLKIVEIIKNGREIGFGYEGEVIGEVRVDSSFETELLGQ